MAPGMTYATLASLRSIGFAQDVENHLQIWPLSHRLYSVRQTVHGGTCTRKGIIWQASGMWPWAQQVAGDTSLLLPRHLAQVAAPSFQREIECSPQGHRRWMAVLSLCLERNAPPGFSRPDSLYRRAVLKTGKSPPGGCDRRTKKRMRLYNFTFPLSECLRVWSSVCCFTAFNSGVF